MRSIAIALFDGYQPLDVTGPHEVFAGVNQVLDATGADGPRYAVTLVAETLEPVRSESAMAIVPQAVFADVGGRLDTLLVPGGEGTRSAIDKTALLDWVRANAPSARRVASVCTGTYVLAAAGLCDGHRVTTHWAQADDLARKYPALTVDPDPIFIEDRGLWTSAGVTAGIDLALAMVAADHGDAVAQVAARHLVMFLRRPGGQTQFAAPVWAEAPERPPVQIACDLIHADPSASHTVTNLAAQVGLSPRHLTRLFRDDLGETPARYVERVRVDAARHVLETEVCGLSQVARRCGFGSAETLRRSFHRRVGVSPDDYRRRFAATA